MHADALVQPRFEELRCVVADQAALGEGALWSIREQSLYWVDILGHRLLRLQAASGQVQEWRLDQEISAIAERRSGPGLLIALRRELALLDPAVGAAAITRHAGPEPERSGNRFNDGKCDSRGRLWVGSMDFACQAPSGALYRFDPDGRWSRHEDGMVVTNGPTWTLDESTLLFNDTVKGQVWAYDFDREAGTLSGRRPWLQLAAADGVPDGMCTDALGRIWIAHWGGSCVSCHHPETAVELGRIRLPVSQVTSCTFGGPDLRTLYITSARQGLSAAQLEAEPLAGSLFAVTVDGGGRPAGTFGG